MVEFILFRIMDPFKIGEHLPHIMLLLILIIFVEGVILSRQISLKKITSLDALKESFKITIPLLILALSVSFIWYIAIPLLFILLTLLYYAYLKTKRALVAMEPISECEDFGKNHKDELNIKNIYSSINNKIVIILAMINFLGLAGLAASFAYINHDYSSNDLLMFQSNTYFINNTSIYYSNYSDVGNIYKYDIKTSMKQKLTEVESKIINIKDEKILYISYPSNGIIYSLKSDGTCNTKVNQLLVNNVHKSDDWIYFSNTNDRNSLYKMKYDGTNITKINDISSSIIQVVNDWIYYKTDSRIGHNDFYMIKTDGRDNVCLKSGKSEYYYDDIFQTKYNKFYIEGNWVFYTNTYEHNRLFKSKLDGTEKVRLNYDTTVNIKLIGKWIYYINKSDGNKIYRINKKGGEREKINDDSSNDIQIIDGWIYYINNIDKKLYRMDCKGNNKVRVIDDDLY